MLKELDCNKQNWNSFKKSLQHLQVMNIYQKRTQMISLACNELTIGKTLKIDLLKTYSIMLVLINTANLTDEADSSQ